MQIMTKRISVIALAACLLVALAFGGYSVAQAEEESWWKTPNNNTLTVKAPEDESAQKDLAAAGAYVNLFKVADAEPEGAYQAFKYTYEEGFGVGDLTLPEVGDSEANKWWQEIADDAAIAVKKDSPAAPPARGDLSEENGYQARMDTLYDGIYLVRVYAKTGSYTDNDDGSTTIKGARTDYTFKPQLVALPSKIPVGGQIASSNPSDWQPVVTIVLKSGQAPSHGSLTISKTINGFEGQPASVVFHVVSTADSPYEYDEYATVYCTTDGAATTTLTHIKAGTIVTVTESYEGARSDLGSEKVMGPIEIKADSEGKVQTEPVSFRNTQNDKLIGGNGIENKYTFDANDRDWKFQGATPNKNTA